MTDPALPIPLGLAAAGRGLWSDVTAGLELRPDEAAVLAQACGVADQIAALIVVLADAPIITTGSKDQDVLHPAVPELRQQRALLASLLGRLSIPEADERDGWDGLDASQRARRAARARWDRRGAA